MPSGWAVKMVMEGLDFKRQGLPEYESPKLNVDASRVACQCGGQEDLQAVKSHELIACGSPAPGIGVHGHLGLPTSGKWGDKV